MQRQIEIPAEQLEAFCSRWKITELALFGSVLREDFRADSDVDVLVSFAPEAEWDLLDLLHIQREFQDIIGRRVDLVERAAVERSENYIRRNSVLGSAQILYAR